MRVCPCFLTNITLYIFFIALLGYVCMDSKFLKQNAKICNNNLFPTMPYTVTYILNVKINIASK